MYLLSVTPMMLHNKCTKPSRPDQEPLCVCALPGLRVGGGVVCGSEFTGGLTHWSGFICGPEGGFAGRDFLKSEVSGGLSTVPCFILQEGSLGVFSWKSRRAGRDLKHEKSGSLPRSHMSAPREALMQGMGKWTPPLKGPRAGGQEKPDTWAILLRIFAQAAK